MVIIADHMVQQQEQKALKHQEIIALFQLQPIQLDHQKQGLSIIQYIIS
jgi:hypothetical protein